MANASKKNLFMIFSNKAADWTGSPQAFIAAVAIIVIWALSGPVFGYSDTWQLVINTGTTIVTFLMVFLIQNTQNRDSKAMQLKLDELIRVTPGAHARLLDIEELSDRDLQHMRDKYERIARDARSRLKDGLSDIDTLEVVLDDE
jgi:low affinity Fe/Cu permease